MINVLNRLFIKIFGEYPKIGDTWIRVENYENPWREDEIISEVVISDVKDGWVQTIDKKNNIDEMTIECFIQFYNYTLKERGK